ncbi:MAG: 5-formyltetrahydrofolate cyclo-ligase [Bacillota bacterium]|nr:5-formyltetrahydrofolate cyclo-ligase [Bacillota bacterium]
MTEFKGNKTELRRLLKLEAEKSPDSERLLESVKVSDSFFKLDAYIKAETVCCYASVSPEVDTNSVMRRVLKDGKRLCLPKIKSGFSLAMLEIKTLDELYQGRFGIPEPGVKCIEIQKKEIDLCIVPCVACTKTGCRLGRGAGFYDRFLKNSEFYKVAFCRKFALLDEIQAEPHDIRMDCVLSDGEVFYINEA